MLFSSVHNYLRYSLKLIISIFYDRIKKLWLVHKTDARVINVNLHIKLMINIYDTDFMSAVKIFISNWVYFIAIHYSAKFIGL